MWFPACIFSVNRPDHRFSGMDINSKGEEMVEKLIKASCNLDELDIDKNCQKVMLDLADSAKQPTTLRSLRKKKEIFDKPKSETCLTDVNLLYMLYKGIKMNGTYTIHTYPIFQRDAVLLFYYKLAHALSLAGK